MWTLKLKRGLKIVQVLICEQKLPESDETKVGEDANDRSATTVTPHRVGDDSDHDDSEWKRYETHSSGNNVGVVGKGLIQIMKKHFRNRFILQEVLDLRHFEISSVSLQIVIILIGIRYIATGPNRNGYRGLFVLLKYIQ